MTNNSKLKKKIITELFLTLFFKQRKHECYNFSFFVSKKEAHLVSFGFCLCQDPHVYNNIEIVYTDARLETFFNQNRDELDMHNLQRDYISCGEQMACGIGAVDLSFYDIQNTHAQRKEQKTIVDQSLSRIFMVS